MFKNMLKSKTMLFSILLAIGGVLEQQQQVITQLVGSQNVGIVMLGISIAVGILRILTTQPLSEKE